MITVPAFFAFTLGIIVYFIGRSINRRFSILREFNVPEPVTGGLLAAGLVYCVYLVSGSAIDFELDIRDSLLVYFFTAIGLNARISDLLKGGRPLFIMLVLTLGFMLIQNGVGIAGASLLGLPPQLGVLAGSASLIGGHGTAIAWAPEFAALGIDNALEIGVAAATLGLVLASLIGGPIARFLISKHNLKSSSDDSMMGIAYEKEHRETIDHLDLMSVLLTLHLAITLGYLGFTVLQQYDIKLPLFVTCLMSAIVLSNTVPHLFPKLAWPARTRALAVLSDFSLGIFLSMSLMSMQLWTIAELAGPLFFILALQTVAAFVFIIFVLFRLMGKDYQAAVLSAGFGGFALGATPTAIANMTAVTKTHGPAPLAFIILPLISAFFVDITNSVIIKSALNF